MRAARHPHEDTLLAYALGRLLPGASLVVAAHLERCEHCAAETRFLEQVGGAVMEVEPAEPMPVDALDRALKRLDAGAPPVVDAAHPAKALAGRRVGAWRWAGAGLRVALVHAAGAPGERVYLLRGQAGAALPEHGHSGRECVAVLDGAYLDGSDRYEAGDFQEADAEHRHRLMAAPDVGCLCLVATEGPLRFAGAARFAQPFLGV